MKPLRVLVVDDSPVFRESLADFLKQRPEIHLVGTAASGSEAVKLVETLSPDLVVMDLIMPGMNGLETTRLIKATPACPPKVILVTLHEPRPFAKAATNAGADGFVRKADIPRLLFPTIRDVCRSEALPTDAPQTRTSPDQDGPNHGPAGSPSSRSILGAVL
jgi:NarL family two-component system response regulator LiaR